MGRMQVGPGRSDYQEAKGRRQQVEAVGAGPKSRAGAPARPPRGEKAACWLPGWLLRAGSALGLLCTFLREPVQVPAGRGAPRSGKRCRPGGVGSLHCTCSAPGDRAHLREDSGEDVGGREGAVGSLSLWQEVQLGDMEHPGGKEGPGAEDDCSSRMVWGGGTEVSQAGDSHG